MKFKLTKTTDGYFLKLAIPITELYKSNLVSGTSYGFELAIDLSGPDGKRIRQDRWNSIHAEGFNLSPSKWGNLIIK